MSDRELIARAIRDAAERGTVPDGMTDQDEIDNHIMETLADAVLAAIGDRLLPPLPDNINELHIHFHYLKNGNHEVWVFGDYRKGSGYRIEEDGEGPTLTAAIQDALSKGEPT